MKMRPTLSASRLILLLTLTVVMLSSMSEGDGQVAPTCFHKYSSSGKNNQVAPKWAEKKIISCHEQNQHGCLPGFVIKTSGKRTLFLRRDTEWLNKKITEGALKCPAVIFK